jgi:predicted RNase H-like HicB family nuclease
MAASQTKATRRLNEPSKQIATKEVDEQKKGKEVSASDYTYAALWSKKERVFIARVAEFPSLEAHGDNRGSSLRVLKSVVDAVLKGLAETGMEAPTPCGLMKQKSSQK